LLNKCECDELLVDAAAAVLQQFVQLGTNQRWRRLARETAAAMQNIEKVMQESVSHCSQGSNHAKLQQAQASVAHLCFAE
jgi:hypothetical protein